MTQPVVAPRVALGEAPSGRPERDVLVKGMLSATKRAVVPMRREFIQRARGDAAPDGSRGSMLSGFARDTTSLDCYLWIVAMASASEPYSAEYPAATWAQAAGLMDYAEDEAARTRWSKAATRLEHLQLLRRERRGGRNRMVYTLLREDGSGAEYTRPKRGATDGHWFVLPHTYWLDGWDRKLSAAEKLMLLIALDQKDGFDISPERTPAWYGISRATAQRGYRGLVAHGILSAEIYHQADPKSPTGWRTSIRYTTLGPWSIASRLKAGKTRKVVEAEREE